jgi:cytochrome c peroxidase
MAAECEQAKSARELIPSRLTDDGEAETALRKSVRVQTSNCTHQEALKSVLISWGVRESTLRALELEIVTRPTAGRTDRKQNPLAVWFSAATRLILPDTVDRDLARAVREFNIRPLEVRRFEADPKFKLGQALFFDPILSGPRNVSCATCHLMAYGTSDGLAHSIGVGGDGLGPIRRMARKTDEHIRNALDLWNRDNNAVRSLFWDGRVEIVDPEGRVFRSPLGRDLPKGLDNALAVQALFPLVTPDEMLGYPNDRSAADLPAGHAGLANELGRSLQSGSDGSHIQDAHNRIMRRLLGTENKAAWQKAYVSLFREAYPRRTEFSIVDLANAIAHFEEMAFATRDSLWERHLLGDTSALSVEGRRGAVIFYGKGRCVVCHRGSLFSDFSYHSIGVFGTWPTDRAEDLGRWNATRVDKDRYKFRTPPLRNVTKTAPYFHDGSERTLKGAIERHLDPLSRSNRYKPDGSFAMTVKQIDAISPILLPRIEVSDREVNDIIAFLTSLEYEPTDLDAIIPRSVPSGLPAAYR